MSERKVLNKYYPPDFDPTKITRRRPDPHEKKGPKQQTVRLMTPFSMRCNTCGEYVYKGKKFNARKEDSNERYLGIPIYRFYIRCTRCSAEITFKTDPKNTDYTAERGASRNFEPWREEIVEETEEERMERLLHEEEENDMKKLELKVEDSRREMEIMDALDEIRIANARRQKAADGDYDPEDILTKARGDRELRESEAQRQDREDEETARRAFEGADGERVRRILLDDREEEVIVRERRENNGEKIKLEDGTEVKIESVPTFKRPLPRKRKAGQVAAAVALGIVTKKANIGLL